MNRMHANGLRHLTQADPSALTLALQEPTCLASRINIAVRFGAVILQIGFKTAVRVLIHSRVLLIDPAI
jgi:hypothetical protein